METSTVYTDMVDSNIPWLGMLPFHWNIRRGKTILKLLSRPVEENDEVVTCFRDGEVTLRKNRREEGFTLSMKETGYQGIEPGDLVVHGMDGFAGAIGISDSRGKGTPVLNIMDSNENKRFLMYYLRALAYKDVFMSLSTGIRIRSCDLRWNKIAALPFVIPTADEQNKIVHFLNTQCKRIDSIILDAKASIEEYKALRMSTIYEAVIYGIDSNVKKKDSGIVWMGMIPEHWDTIKVKYVSKFKAGVGHENTWDFNGKYVIVNSRFVSTGGEAKKYTEEAMAPLNIGDICIVLSDLPNGRALSRTYYVESNDSYTLNQRVGAFYDYDIDGKFFAYVMNRNKGLLKYDDGTNQTNLKYADVLNCYITLPPLDEQKRISEYLDKRCEKIDILMSEKQALINDMEEYKKSIIYEIVTGKRRVV